MACKVTATPVSDQMSYGHTVKCDCGFSSPTLLSREALKATILGHLIRSGVVTITSVA